MRIRESTVADHVRLALMAGEFLKLTPYGRFFPPDPGRLREMIETVQRVGVILVAELEDTDIRHNALNAPHWRPGELIVGMLALVVVRPAWADHWYGDEVVWWVDQAYRGGAVGPALLEAAERWALAKKATMLKMIAPADSAVGRFLEHQGYTPLETAYLKLLQTPTGPVSFTREEAEEITRRGSIQQSGAPRSGPGRRGGNNGGKP